MLSSRTRSLLAFSLYIFTARGLTIVFSLLQAIVWVRELDVELFGVLSMLIASSHFISLAGRAGIDNILVRDYATEKHFRVGFIKYSIASLTVLIFLSLITVSVYQLFISRNFNWIEFFGFSLLVLFYSVSLVLSKIMIAQNKQALSSILGSTLPVMISVLSFLLLLPYVEAIALDIQYIALLCYALGYAISVLVFFVILRDFIRQSFVDYQRSDRGVELFQSQEQFYFLGYQSLALLRTHGFVLGIGTAFGASVAGVFALAFRFGNLLTHLNEPARLYMMPRVSSASKSKILYLYRLMVGLNIVLGTGALGVLIAIYLNFEMPFPTDDPFSLYAIIILLSAVFNLYTGPVGIILAMSKNERSNFRANMIGVLVGLLFFGVSVVLHFPLLAIIGVAMTSITINIVNILQLAFVMKRGFPQQAVELSV